MMNRNEFFDYVKDNVKKYLPPSFEEAEIIFQEVTKQNDQHLTGLSIRRDGEVMVPNIYLDSFYKEYREGADPDKLVGDIADSRIEYDRAEVPEDFKKLMDYEKIKDKLQIVLCDPEMNQERLADKVSKPFGEYTATYQLMISGNEDTLGTVAVTQSLIEHWGISPEQLHADALVAEDARIPSLFNMSDLVQNMMTGQNPPNLLDNPEALDFNGPPMYCLTTADKVFGASLMVRNDILEKAADVLGTNFYILPSSTHEVLLVPEVFESDAKALVGMVKDINEAEVAPNDRLSDKVQFYDRETGVLENAVARQERLEGEKEAERAVRSTREGGRRSIHDRLSANKVAVQAKTAPSQHKEKNKAAENAL